MKNLISKFAIPMLLLAMYVFQHPSCEDSVKKFNPEKDLLSLHYDHAPDKDDGWSKRGSRPNDTAIYVRKRVDKKARYTRFWSIR